MSICYGATKTISADNGTKYLWSTGEIINPINVKPTANTIYSVTGTGATRTAFIFQATTIVAYLFYLWGLSHWDVPLAVYWTVEYLFVIGLGVQSVIYLKYKHY